MSPTPARRSEDLVRLRDEGYLISLVGGSLVVSDVPFLADGWRVARGTLVVPLEMAGDVTIAPRRHDVLWAGGIPRGGDGAPLWSMSVMRRSGTQGGVVIDHALCHVPHGREFHDYHELVTSYVTLLGAPARLIDPTVTARSGGGFIADHNPNSPFAYVDTAASRSGIEDLTGRMEGLAIGIVGLGGTGSYVLDLVAKTPVRSIHLYDDDVFDQHNAFRAPGAAGRDEFAGRPAKVDHLAAIYSNMHRGVVPHRVRLDAGSAGMVRHLDFAFLCVDDARARGEVVGLLERQDVPFVDTGMGVSAGDGGLAGLARITVSTATTRETARSGMPLGPARVEDEYRAVVQIAELNALSAALAVIGWKRSLGFYAGGAGSIHTVFDISSGGILSSPAVAPASGGPAV